MHPFATDFASGRLAPLTFDRVANPDGCAPTIAGGVLRLAVERGAYRGAVRPGFKRSDRCEVREPGKTPLAVALRHGFVLRLAAGFPAVARRFVAAQMKLNGGLSPVFALRVDRGRLYADWRLDGRAIEHHGALPASAQRWTRFDLLSGPDGAALFVDGVLATRLRGPLGPPDLTRYLKLGPYRDRDPAWGDAPAAVEVRSVLRAVLI